MARFFEAMQRAAGAKAKRGEAPEQPMTMPELDDALFSGDGPESDVFSLPEPEHDLESDGSGEAQGESPAETPSAIIRTIESDVREGRTTPISPPGEGTSSAGTDPIVRRAADSAIRVVGDTSVVTAIPKSRLKAPIRLPDPTVLRVHPSYDRIVQRLLAFRRTPRQSVVLVSSAVAGEGSSTVARNVAAALSHSGTENVLLLDANLRNPCQHEEFDVPREGGFTDVLQGEAALTTVINHDVGVGISLVTAGTSVKSPTQVLTATGIKGVMMALLSLYDWIIVDSPPATVYPDASSIGTACGAAILVVRAESTRSEVAGEAKEILEGTGAELVGAVLNRRRFHIPNAIYRRL